MTPRISGQDTRRLLDAVARLHACEETSELPAAMRAAVSSLVRGEIVAYSEFDLTSLTRTTPAEQDLDALTRLLEVAPFVTTDDPQVQRDINARVPWMVRFAEQHPLFGVALRESDPRVARISDFLTLPAFRSLGLYREFFQPLAVNRQIAVCPTNGGGLVTGLTVNRAGAPFTARDRHCLTLLKPHLRQAFRATLERARLRRLLEQQQRVLENLPAAVLGLTPDGRAIQFETAMARRFLLDCFPGAAGRGTGLPEQLQSWALNVLRRRSRLDDPQAETACMAFPTARGTLRVTHVHLAGQSYLLLSLENRAEAVRRLAGLGLTPREAEVLNAMRTVARTVRLRDGCASPQARSARMSSGFFQSSGCPRERPPSAARKSACGSSVARSARRCGCEAVPPRTKSQPEKNACVRHLTDACAGFPCDPCVTTVLRGPLCGASQMKGKSMLRFRNAAPILLIAMAILPGFEEPAATAGQILEHHTQMSVQANAFSGEELFREVLFSGSPVRLTESGEIVDSLGRVTSSGSALAFGTRSPGAFLGASAVIAGPTGGVAQASAAWVDDILIGRIHVLPVPEFLRMNLHVTGILEGTSQASVINFDVEGNRIIGDMGGPGGALVEFGGKSAPPEATGNWTSASFHPLAVDLDRWLFEGTFSIDLPLEGPDLPAGRIDGPGATAQTRFAVTLDTLGSSVGLAEYGAAVFGETMAITSLTLPDGSTPESHGYTVSFASGMPSPNAATSAVPEPSSLVLLGTGLLSLIGYRSRRRHAASAAN